jgi:hypothetical protein
MAKKKRKTKLTAEFWANDAEVRRAMVRRIVELQSRMPPERRLPLPPDP